MKIMIVAGASGGHVFPALALAEELKSECQIKFICDRGWPLENIIGKGYDAEGISVTRRKGGWGTFPFAANLFKAFGESLKIIDGFQPDALVAFGSYVSFPAAVAARLKKIPILIHEQNILPGSANRVISRFATKVAVSFAESKKYLPKRKTVLTGCPIRRQLSEAEKGSALKRFGMKENKFTILVLGGSQGSQSINLQFLGALRGMDEKNNLQVIHLTGKSDYLQVERAYQDMEVIHSTFAFLEEMGYAYKLADLIISRAGASAIAEISYFARPAILIPYPFAGSHQLYNARVLSREGAAVLIEDKDLSVQALKREIIKLINSPVLLAQMSGKSAALAMPAAASALAVQVKKTAQRT
jgi:UDP-N-acetylglucosamine--N-acetylmuramyl-(pentapeptide) pyrophosphoryl-undecaprenol N-acetylglucosamine transferase